LLTLYLNVFKSKALIQDLTTGSAELENLLIDKRNAQEPSCLRSPVFLVFGN